MRAVCDIKDAVVWRCIMYQWQYESFENLKNDMFRKWSLGK
jgi:hypothetical protein